MNKLFLALSILALTTYSCGADTKLVKNQLYRITTQQDSGYVRIDKKAWLGGSMQGTYYVDGGKLYADIRHVTIKSSRRKYSIKTENGSVTIDGVQP